MTTLVVMLLGSLMSGLLKEREKELPVLALLLIGQVDLTVPKKILG
jgi:hypothetical protein